jgi:hypothetical protein
VKIVGAGIGRRSVERTGGRIRKMVGGKDGMNSGTTREMIDGMIDGMIEEMTGDVREGRERNSQTDPVTDREVHTLPPLPLHLPLETFHLTSTEVGEMETEGVQDVGVAGDQCGGTITEEEEGFTTGRRFSISLCCR